MIVDTVTLKCVDCGMEGLTEHGPCKCTGRYRHVLSTLVRDTISYNHRQTGGAPNEWCDSTITTVSKKPAVQINSGPNGIGRTVWNWMG